MRTLALLFVAIFVAAQASDVVILTPANFDTIVDGSKNVLGERARALSDHRFAPHD